MERSRDRRSRHSQDVKRLPQMLQAVFVFHTEALLLVDDHQAKVLELNVFGDQSMRSNEDIDASFGQAAQNLFLFRVAAKAADPLDDKWIFRQTAAEGAIVLLGQDSGWHEHCHLLAVVHGLEGRANR